MPHQTSFELFSCGMWLVEMEVRLGNWSKGQCNAYVQSLGLNKAISEIVYNTNKQNALCANDNIKHQMPNTTIMENWFISRYVHWGAKASFVSWDSQKYHEKYMKQYSLGNKFSLIQIHTWLSCNHSVLSFYKYGNLSEWCLGMACVFPFLYSKVTTTVELIICYGNNYMCMVYSMYVVVTHLTSQRQTSYNNNYNTSNCSWIAVINSAMSCMIKPLLHSGCPKVTM